jgi:hypothetical protein
MNAGQTSIATNDDWGTVNQTSKWRPREIDIHVFVGELCEIILAPFGEKCSIPLFQRFDDFCSSRFEYSIYCSRNCSFYSFDYVFVLNNKLIS